MAWEAYIIEALQNAGTKTLDYFVYILTFMGDKLFFIAIAAIIYWCFSKRFGFRFLNVYLFSAASNEGIKSIFKRPRPFDAYESIRSIFSKSHGWSFPSGHSNSIATTSTQITLKAWNIKKFFRTALILSLAAVFIVMFSRMYLGQHYLTDVVVGTVLGIILTFLFDFIYNLLEKREYHFWIVALPISVIMTVILILTGSAQSNYEIISSFAAYSAAAFGYAIEKKFIDYNVKSGKIYKQLIKIIIGLAITVLILMGGEYLLGLFIPSGSVFEVVFVWYLLYFLVGLWVMSGAAFVFKKLKL